MRKLWLAAAIIGSALAQSRTPSIVSEANVRAVAFSKDGSTVAGGCADSKVRVWDTRSGELRQTFPLGAEESLVAMSPATNTMAVASPDGRVQLRAIDGDRRVSQFPTTVRGSREAALAPAAASGAMMLARSNRVEGNSRDEVMRVWDASGKERFAVPSGVGGTSAIAMSADAKLLAAGSYDTDLRVWDTRSGELLRKIDELPVSTFAMAFTPDGKYLATGGVDRNLYLWDTRTWKLAHKLTGQPEMICAVAVTPDGRRIAAGGCSELTVENPAKVLVWDIATQKTVQSFDTPRMVVSLAFSPDGKTLAVSSGTKSVRLLSVDAN